MHRLASTACICAVALAAFGGVGTAHQPQAPHPDVASVVKGNDAFAVDLYQQLATKDGNLFFSPYSISNALAMTYAGARGNTAAEIQKTLHFTLGQDKLHPAFADLIKKISGNGQPRKYQLTVANRLWGQKDYGFHADFLKLTQTHYGAGLKEVDFIGATEAARQAINAWVEEQTKDKIKELLQPDVLSVDTRLVLTNAIYFKAAWLREFNEKATAPGKFLLPGNKDVQVPLMHLTTDAGYYDGGSFALLDLPYEDNQLSMVVVLPKEVDGLPALAKSLTSAKLGEWLSKRAYRPVDVTLPKFKFTSQFRLKGALTALGMKTPFSGAADFSGMTTRDNLFISDVIHKAFVDVHEKGTEAAAATAVILDKKKGGPLDEPVTFRADHPFVFLIRDNQTGSILFLGRLARP
jgi:serpin B